MRFVFRSHALALVAAIAAINDVRMEQETAVAKQQKLDAFAADFTKRMDAADAAAIDEGATDAGSESTADDVEATDDATSDEDAPQGADKDDNDDESTARDRGADDADDDDREDTDADDVDDETDGSTDEDDDELDPDFRAAAARAKLPTSLEDLPAEARPLVKRRLKEVEAGFTRAMMDARSYRAEERFRQEHPADYIAEMLAADPELEAQVSAELEKRADDTYSESRKIINDDRRRKAVEAIDAVQQGEVKREARITEVESLAAQACAKYGIPFGRAVEAAIANAIITSDKGDIDNADVSVIVKGIAQELGAVSRKERIEAGKERVQAKVRDRAAAPKIRPGSGRGTAPAQPAKAKKTLEENLSASVAKLFPGAE